MAAATATTPKRVLLWLVWFMAETPDGPVVSGPFVSAY
jgi:hypothetical protein